MAVLISAAITVVRPMLVRAQCGVTTTCDEQIYLPAAEMPAPPTQTPVPSNTPQPTIIPTETPKPLPDVMCGNVIVNGGFESGPEVGWFEASDAEEPIVRSRADLPVEPFAGEFAAWLGGYNDAADVLLTRYTIAHRPPDTGRHGDLISAELKFVWAMVSDEITTGSWDAMGVLLVDESDEEVDRPELLAAVDNTGRRDTWMETTVEVTNQLVRRDGWSNSLLSMVAVTDGSLDTSWFVDEVRLTVCARGEQPLLRRTSLAATDGLPRLSLRDWLGKAEAVSRIDHSQRPIRWQGLSDQ